MGPRVAGTDDEHRGEPKLRVPLLRDEALRGGYRDEGAWGRFPESRRGDGGDGCAVPCCGQASFHRSERDVGLGKRAVARCCDWGRGNRVSRGGEVAARRGDRGFPRVGETESGEVSGNRMSPRRTHRRRGYGGQSGTASPSHQGMREDLRFVAAGLEVGA